MNSGPTGSRIAPEHNADPLVEHPAHCQLNHTPWNPYVVVLMTSRLRITGK
jgi:hypothetical protein